MNYEENTLIILDTNKIRNNFEWEKDYSNFEPKGDFIKLIEWIEKNQLSDKIFLGLPEIVIEEIIHTRYENFSKGLKELKSTINRFNKMTIFDFSKIILPNEDYNYHDYIKDKILEFIKGKKNLIILKLEKELYPKILENLIENATKKKKPFHEKQNGFKDALIWEIILNNPELNKYSNIFLLSENEKDFNNDLKEEFKHKLKKDLNLEINTNILITSLENIYGLKIKYPELISFFKTDYFKLRIIEVIGEKDFNNENVKIQEINITELNQEDLEDFGQQETYTETDFSHNKKVTFNLSGDSKSFYVELLFDSIENEIISINFGEQ